ALTRQMKEAQVRVIIAEPYSDAALVQRVAALGGAREVQLAASVGALPEARDYLALFDVDVARLADALRSPSWSTCLGSLSWPVSSCRPSTCISGSTCSPAASSSWIWPWLRSQASASPWPFSPDIRSRARPRTGTRSPSRWAEPPSSPSRVPSP